MTPYSRRVFISAGSIFFVGSAAEVLKPKTLESPPIELGAKLRIPDHIGSWYAHDDGPVVMPDQGGADGIYDQILAKSFTSPTGHNVSLLFGYSNIQTGLHRLHRPEACYDSAGYLISRAKKEIFEIPKYAKIKGNSFIASRPGSSECVFYWTRLGFSFPQSNAEQTELLIKKNLSGVSVDGILVRISTFVENGIDPFLVASEFCNNLFACVDANTRILMVGV